MQSILIIIFLTIWKFNTTFCDHYYNYETEFGQWYYLRCDVYEVMFLIAVIIPWFKSTVYSKTIMFFGGVLIGWSVVGKVFLDSYNTTDIDMFIILPLAITSSLYYLYQQKKNK